MAGRTDRYGKPGRRRGVTDADRLSNQPRLQFERLATVDRADFGENSFVVAVTFLYEGSTYLEAKNDGRAGDLPLDALRILLNGRGESDIYAARVRFKLGHALLMQGRAGEAEQQTRTGYETLRIISPDSAIFLSEAQQDSNAEQNSLQALRSTPVTH